MATAREALMVTKICKFRTNLTRKHISDTVSTHFQPKYYIQERYGIFDFSTFFRVLAVRSSTPIPRRHFSTASRSPPALFKFRGARFRDIRIFVKTLKNNCNTTCIGQHFGGGLNAPKCFSSLSNFLHLNFDETRYSFSIGFSGALRGDPYNFRQNRQNLKFFNFFISRNFSRN